MRVDREESDRPDQQNLFPPEIKADRCSVWECLHISTVCKLKFILFKLINLSEINEVFSQGHPQTASPLISSLRLSLKTSTDFLWYLFTISCSPFIKVRIQ